MRNYVKKTNNPKLGRKKIVWDDKQYRIFEGLCHIQATLEEIEDTMDVDRETLYRLCEEHYKDKNGEPQKFSTVYKKYSAGGKASIRRTQFKLMEKNTAMAIWLGKQYLGQTDKQETVENNENKIDKLKELIESIKNV